MKKNVNCKMEVSRSEDDLRREIRHLGLDYLELMGQGFNTDIIERTLPIRERQTLLLTQLLQFALDNPNKEEGIRRLQTEVDLLDKVSQSVNWWYTDIIEYQRLRYLASADKRERVHQSYKSKVFLENEQ
jgi:hypothetical protein